MRKKDRGWEYLNSSMDDFNYDKENDGSWGYKNDDGSGSFYGSDGSWGYTNSDGSASYYGADGSWGYRNADGSCSYYGADGSWDYKEPDGNCSYYECDDDDDSGGSRYIGGGGSAAATAGAFIGLGMAALAVIKSRQSKENIRRQQKLEEQRKKENALRLELEREKKNKRNAKIKRLWSAIAHKKMIKININSTDCIGKNYLQIESIFKQNGFSKINFNIFEDLEFVDISKENEVSEIIVDGNNFFMANTEVKYDSDVVITFHKLKKAKPPISYREIKGKHGNSVAESFRKEGFVNVEEHVIKDITFGWLKKDGYIDSLSIDDDIRYKTDKLYRIDARVIVTYHTKKDK